MKVYRCQQLKNDGFPQILVYYLHWHSVSFTVKNTPDLVKISVKNIRLPRSVVPPIYSNLSHC